MPAQEDIFKFGQDAGYSVERVQLLRAHYARTLNMWAAKLEANKQQAIEMQSEEVYDTYMHYLTGCENFFRKGITQRGAIHVGQVAQIEQPRTVIVFGPGGPAANRTSTPSHAPTVSSTR